MTTPTTTTPQTPADPFGTLAQRLAAWRATRARGQRIPEDFWEEAVRLARTHGLSPTTTALKLSYYDLQKRMEPASAPPKRRMAQPSFVELPAPGFASPPSDPGTLELIRPCGTRLLLRLPEASPKALLPLVGLLLRRQA